ncbi:hypothetical protein [Pedobacter terrae]|uniref:hypothetical protein n=1 Tax=Pedobacter terrae TaxID=405671 RepID=UPI002FF4EFA0
MWTPISLTELEGWISRGESKLDGEPLNFWKLIKIPPQKWQETEYGNEGGGFWVVAIFGNSFVFYNDIEEGFNVSTYQTYGDINEYWCEQTELDCIVKLLYRRIKEDKQKAS